MATLDYELILMLDPQAGDEQRDKVAADAKSKLETAGEIKHEGTWGTRKMAYEIDKRGEADYRVWRFTGDKALLDDLDHSLKITDGVLRFRIFKVPADSPNIVPPDTEQIMRRDEDDRGRGRGRDGDRGGPRRPRSDSGPPPDRSPQATPAPAAAEGSPEGTPAPAPDAPPPAAPSAPAAAPAAPTPEPATAAPDSPPAEAAAAPPTAPPDADPS